MDNLDNSSNFQCEKCQSIFRQILRMQTTWSLNTNHQDAPDFIRMVMDTERCDEIFDLSRFRQKFVKIITPEGIARIQTYESTEDDQKRARYAMIHYDQYTKKHLAKALSWYNWFGHNIVDRYDRLVGFHGFLGSTYSTTKHSDKNDYNSK